MKQTALILAAMAFAFTACDSDKKSEPSVDNIPQTELNKKIYAGEVNGYSLTLEDAGRSIGLHNRLVGGPWTIFEYWVDQLPNLYCNTGINKPPYEISADGLQIEVSNARDCWEDVFSVSKAYCWSKEDASDITEVKILENVSRPELLPTAEPAIGVAQFHKGTMLLTFPENTSSQYRYFTIDIECDTKIYSETWGGEITPVFTIRFRQLGQGEK